MVNARSTRYFGFIEIIGGGGGEGWSRCSIYFVQSASYLVGESHMTALGVSVKLRSSEMGFTAFWVQVQRVSNVSCSFLIYRGLDPAP